MGWDQVLHAPVDVSAPSAPPPRLPTRSARLGPAALLVAEPTPGRTVAEVRFRALVLVFAAIAGFFAMTSSPIEPERDPNAVSRYKETMVDDQNWINAIAFSENLPAVRENRVSVWNQYHRMGSGPDIKTSQFPQPEHPNPDRIRVLVVGDSYVWGHGYDEPAMRWPARLEAQLNARTAPGTFEVIAQARNNFSAFGQADWFTKERFEQLDPDVFVLGYFENDIFPSFTEPSICPEQYCEQYDVTTRPEYVECISGERGLTARLVRHLVKPVSQSAARSMLQRHCDPERIAKQLDFPTFQRIYEDPRVSPYWSKFIDAYARLSSAAGDRQLFVFETPIYPSQAAFKRHVAPVLDAYGFNIVPRTATDKVLADLAALGPVEVGLPLAMVSPADGHASPLLTAAFATDTAAEIIAKLPAERLRAASRATTAPTRTLVDATHPAPVTVGSLDENRAVLTFTMRNDRKPLTTTPEGDLPPQYVPCVSVGAPYLQISFDPNLPPATKLAFRFESLSAGTRELFGYGYNEREQMFNRSLGRIRAGEVVNLTAGEFRGLRLASSGENCALDRVITAPTTTVTLTRR